MSPFFIGAGVYVSASGPISCPDSREKLRQQLCDLLGPVVEDHEAVLVDVELLGGGGSQTVRLLVHRDPGVTVELCQAISREVSDLLDMEDPISGRYRLEVTSPGLDRLLRTDGDFQRARARLVKAVLNNGRTVVGRLLDWSADTVRLDGADGPCAVPRAEIARATIEVEFR